MKDLAQFLLDNLLPRSEILPSWIGRLEAKLKEVKRNQNKRFDGSPPKRIQAYLDFQAFLREIEKFKLASRPDVDECTICFEILDGVNVETLECRHKFHRNCITKWLELKSDCPHCRKHIVRSEDFPPLRSRV